ncbi:Aste57867_216 [Aphanomyces stellatus]|uniref:Aste57867_216 protein n=1 Tax=Aphanomyces stellatus TaxID=120398 RepID=A0A485K388_9STRA|nr:hypothetical protein As57867_000216 [Aphanomyces stellatus]VFT77442.1 Aste57867_216 [Aphanomyces stellatus]
MDVTSRTLNVVASVIRYTHGDRVCVARVEMLFTLAGMAIVLRNVRVPNVPIRSQHVNCAKGFISKFKVSLPIFKFDTISPSSSSPMRFFVPLSFATTAFAVFTYEETTIDLLQAGIKAEEITVQGVVKHNLERIDALNHKGPKLKGVIETTPAALEVATKQDKATSSPKGLLHGIPILIKDNIATKGDGLTACAGSLAMEGNFAPEDVFVVKKLREAGAIISDMPIWSSGPIGGVSLVAPWSARGGITKNSYVLTAPTPGSSSGFAVSVAANMIPVSIGTETDGIIVSPSSVKALVGMKPTLGLISRTRIIPISSRQDSAGPMGRPVRDVALVLEAIAGYDPRDPRSKDVAVPKYSQSLQAKPTSFKNVHIAISEAFIKAIQWLEAQGATIVKAPLPNAQDITESKCAFTLLKTEFREDVETYLGTLSWKVGVTPMKTLKDITDYIAAHPKTELNVLDQTLMLASLAAPSRTNQTYIDLLKLCNDLAITNGIDKYFNDTQTEGIVSLTDAWGQPTSPDYAAIAAYPILTVPLGYNSSFPFGISFVGKPFTEEKLLQYGYVFEQASKARIPPDVFGCHSQLSKKIR